MLKKTGFSRPLQKRAGFASPFLVILLLVVIAVAVAYFTMQNEPPTVSVPAGAPSSQSASNLIVSPTSGTIPLSVTFGINRNVNNVETIDFGDGTSDTSQSLICSIQYCMAHHTYTVPGVYTAQFQDASGASLRSVTIQASAGQQTP